MDRIFGRLQEIICRQKTCYNKGFIQDILCSGSACSTENQTQHFQLVLVVVLSRIFHIPWFYQQFILFKNRKLALITIILGLLIHNLAQSFIKTIFCKDTREEKELGGQRYLYLANHQQSRYSVSPRSLTPTLNIQLTRPTPPDSCLCHPWCPTQREDLDLQIKFQSLENNILLTFLR